MGKLLFLFGVSLLLVGALMTLGIPLDWIGHLPGDFSYQWGETLVFIPITTSLVFTVALSVLFFLISKS